MKKPSEQATNGIRTGLMECNREDDQPMARRHPPPFAEEPADPNAEARKLAEKMASVLHDKPTRDAAVAVAILMAGVVASHAKNADDASELLEGIQKLTQRFVSAWIDDEKRDLLN
jgi:hypothetical protein